MTTAVKTSLTNLSKCHGIYAEQQIFGDWHACVLTPTSTGSARSWRFFTRGHSSCRVDLIITQLLRSAHAPPTRISPSDFTDGTPSSSSCLSQGAARVTEQFATHLSAAPSTIPD